MKLDNIFNIYTKFKFFESLQCIFNQLFVPINVLGQSLYINKY